MPPHRGTVATVQFSVRTLTICSLGSHWSRWECPLPENVRWSFR